MNNTQQAKATRGNVVLMTIKQLEVLWTKCSAAESSVSWAIGRERIFESTVLRETIQASIKFNELRTQDVVKLPYLK